MILMMMNIMFILTKHPISMSLIMISQTINLMMMLSMMISTFWYSYILFIVMIGGIMILFLYMTSIASNLKFNFYWKYPSVMLIMLIFSGLTVKNFYFTKSTSIKTSMSKFFNFPTNMLMIILILNLLLILIASVNMVKTKFGPLRKK